MIARPSLEIRLRTRTVLAVSLLATFCAADAHAARGRKIDIAAPDGVVLRATYWAAKKPGPGVLLLPMCNTTRKSWAGLGPKLAKRGIHALALDYRGFGDSGGKRSFDPAARRRDADEIWPGDVDAALAELRRRSGGGALFGAAGGSCGVHQAVMLARRQGEVRALALLAGTTDRAGETFLAANPWLPLLGVAARDDGDAVETLRWILGFSTHPANRILEYATGGHGTELFAREKGLETQIVDWFATHLVAEPVVPKPPVEGGGGPSARLAAELRAPDAPSTIRARVVWKGGDLPSALPPEAAVNRVGYQLLEEKRQWQAIRLLQLNTELYPDSANAWDSLSEAHAKAGDAHSAAMSARQALALLPDDPARDDRLQRAIRAAAMARLLSSRAGEERR